MTPYLVIVICIVSFAVALELFTAFMAESGIPKRKSKPKHDEAFDADWDYQRGCWKSPYWRREEWINNHAIPNLYVMPLDGEVQRLKDKYQELDIPLPPYPRIFKDVPLAPKDRPGYTRMMR